MRLMPALQTHAQVHLMANILSVVGSLLRRHPDVAEDLLAHLVAYLRGQLDARHPLVPLADELRLVRIYAGVERARLGARLRLEIAVGAEAVDALVPPLVLQPLVENAIWHGISRRSAGGRLRILARVNGRILHVVVVDDGPGLRRSPATGERAGWGLLGVRLRLAALWGTGARLRVLGRPGAGTLAAISLPAVYSDGGAAGPGAGPRELGPDDGW